MEMMILAKKEMYCESIKHVKIWGDTDEDTSIEIMFDKENGVVVHANDITQGWNKDSNRSDIDKLYSYIKEHMENRYSAIFRGIIRTPSEVIIDLRSIVVLDYLTRIEKSG